MALQIRTLKIDPPVLLAPMAGVTDSSFRQIARELGCPAVVTEMVSAEGIKRSEPGSMRLLNFEPIEHPIIAQIFGRVPESMAEAALVCDSRGFDGIDINMGCPVRKVVRNGAGAALMQEPEHAALIVSAMRRVTDLPISVKLRSGWSSSQINLVEMARRLFYAGVDYITVHPRTRSQFFSDKADWNLIEAAVKAVEIPVIGNGDLRVSEDAKKMLSLTGCSGVMVGRAALGNPWLPAAMAAGLAGGQAAVCEVLQVKPAEIYRVFCNHLEKMIKSTGSAHRAVLRMRKHMVWYTRGIEKCSVLRRKLSAIKKPDQMRQALAELLFHQNEGDDTEETRCIETTN